MVDNLVKEKDKGGFEESEQVIKMIKSALSELANIKIHKDSTIEKTLIDGLIIMTKKMKAIMEYTQQIMKKH